MRRTHLQFMCKTEKSARFGGRKKGDIGKDVHETKEGLVKVLTKRGKGEPEFMKGPKKQFKCRPNLAKERGGGIAGGKEERSGKK